MMEELLNAVSTISFAIFNLLIFISIIVVIYKIFTEYKKPQQKPSLIVFLSAVVFIISTLLCVTDICVIVFIHLYPLIIRRKTDYNLLNTIALNLFPVMYITQNYLLLFVLFTRVYYIFKDSSMKLHKITVNCFIFAFVSIPIAFLLCLPILNRIEGTLLWTIVVSGIFISMILFMLFLIFLFLSKLFEVFKNIDDYTLISIITKTSILAIISITMTLCTSILIIIRFYIHNDYYIHAISWCVSIDIYTNFLCIVLSLKTFNTYYNILCKCIDTRCQTLCFHLIFGKNTSVSDINQLAKMNTTAQSTALSRTDGIKLGDYGPSSINIATIPVLGPSCLNLAATPVFTQFDVKTTPASQFELTPKNTPISRDTPISYDSPISMRNKSNNAFDLVPHQTLKPNVNMQIHIQNSELMKIEPTLVNDEQQKDLTIAVEEVQNIDVH